MKRMGLILFTSFCLTAVSFAQAPQIVSVTPIQNELNVPVSTNISVTFNIDMDETTINDTTFVVNAMSTGLHEGVITYNSLTKTATFDPMEDFEEGEVVTVVLTTGIKSYQGVPLDNSYIWSFTTLVDDGTATFETHSIYTAGDSPWSICAADFDGDGDIDISTANTYSNDVSVLLNNGDGTFAPHSVYPVGEEPWSVFAADLDSDGDIDLATSNHGSDDVSILENISEFGCDYTPGDINGDDNVMGNDVTYGVRYFKGLGNPPPDSCWNDSTGSWLYSAGDANGSCTFTGSDVIFLVGYFKGYNPEISWCPQTPPVGGLLLREKGNKTPSIIHK